MSRIYEALLKEMQATAPSSVDGPLSPAILGLEPDRTGADKGEGRAENSGPSVQSSSPSTTSGPLRLDALLRSCARPRWKLHQDYGVLFNKDSLDLCAEKFRSLRACLNRLRERNHLRTLLVTSSVEGEGKSFVSLNLARVIARQHERQALLIDADLRAPRLHVALGAPSSPGLSEYLLGRADESSIIQMGTTENLFFIPAGGPVSNPAELLASERAKGLLERLSPVVDWVIVDAPPLLLASDAALLAAVCDGTILVVGAGTTPSNVAQMACQELKDSNLLGIVLNGAEDGAYGTYGYYTRSSRA
jgi:capsular exopolysaccharide synthesis family protein